MLLLIACTGARADLAFSVADLGTLGGATSTANGVAGPGTNASGMIVGSSTTNDNSEHAFLYANGQIFDLNTLCDLSQSDFRVLTVAKTISDSCLIIGEGITNNGDKHAFLLTPLSVEGGRWSYVCCQWCWIQEGEVEGGGVWWWESDCGCYRWHGPPGRHPPCPPRPPPCWWFPLPCPPPCHRPTPPPNVTPTPTPRYPGNPTPTPTLPPPVRRTPTPTPPNYPGTPLYPEPTPTPHHGHGGKSYPTPSPNYPGTFDVQPTPTPHRGRGGKSHSTPPPTFTTQTVGAKGTPAPRHSRGHATPTPGANSNSHGGSSGTRGKGKPTPKPTAPDIR